jgi:hypothetical protein
VPPPHRPRPAAPPVPIHWPTVTGPAPSDRPVRRSAAERAQARAALWRAIIDVDGRDLVDERTGIRIIAHPAPGRGRVMGTWYRRLALLGRVHRLLWSGHSGATNAELVLPVGAGEPVSVMRLLGDDSAAAARLRHPELGAPFATVEVADPGAWLALADGA